MSATLQFPKTLEVHVIDVATRQPVAHIGLMLTVFAPRKNNYHLAKVSDAFGEVRVTATELRDSIRKDQELFPMDYASALDECDAEIEIKVCTAEEVKRAVQAMELFKSVAPNDHDLLRDFKTSNNAMYVSEKQRVKLDMMKEEVVVMIMTRSL